MLLLSNEKREFALATAAILHDVGKVAQRYTRGKNHSQLGREFINNLPNLDDNVKGLIATLVGEHHTSIDRSSLDPENRDLLRILQESDWRSASHDREDRDPEEFRDDPRMHNIYEYVHLDREHIKKSERSFSLITVESMADVRDGTDPLAFTDISYEKIWKDLIQEISKISMRDFRGFFDSLDSVLMNYLTFVPSAFYYSEPNITLYDHLRLTAAIALSDFRNRAKDEEKKVIFIMGEVSGIQKYIFNYMVSEGADDRATKRLRGRSFSVRLVTDSVVSLIMDRLGLFRFNVIWEKSDGFLIMAGASPENVDLLKVIREDVELGLIEFNRGLSLAISWKDMPMDGLRSDSGNVFRGVLDSLARDLSARKRRTIDNKMKQAWEDILEVEPPGGRICKLCGLSTVGDSDRCINCRNEEDLGERIVKEGEIWLSHDSNGLLNFHYGSSVYSYHLDSRGGNGIDVIYVNRFDHSDARGRDRTILQGNFSPMSGNSVISLNDMLCKNREEGKRCLYLGIAKADVDNMGLIVTEGVDNLTLSKYASLSGLTSLFFSVLVNKIAERLHIYVIYSGGDDVSAMGEAGSIIEFTNMLNRAFSQWAKNDEITISAGIAVTGHSFPVRQGIEIASENLEHAKQNGKDSLGIYGLAIKWKWIEELRGISDKISEFLARDEAGRSRIGRSFPMVLIDLDRENPYRDTEKMDLTSQKGRGIKLRIPDSYIFYYLRRNLSRSDEREVKELTARISEKDVFKNIRFVAYNVILKMRRDEYGSRKI